VVRAEASDFHLALDTLKLDDYYNWRCEVGYPGLRGVLAQPNR
jgi:hypothetical protein